MYKQKIADALTGEEFWRDYTKEEIAAEKLAEAEIEKLNAQAIAQIEIRKSALAKLAALGLTEDEIAAL